MSNELRASGQPGGSIIPAVKREQVLALDLLIKSSRQEIEQARADGNDMLIAFTLAEVTQQLRTQLVTMLPDIKHLVGSPLGIEVYPPTAKYGDDVIVDAVLEGLLKGMRLVGGEMGIHSGRLYDTKKYWERVVRTYPGIVCEEPVLGTPRDMKVGDKLYACVNAILEWRLNGRADKIERVDKEAIVVIWNSGMQIDAIHGKVKRRLYRMAYAKIANTQLEDDDADDAIDGEILATKTELPPVEPEAQPADDAETNKRRVQQLIDEVEGTLLSLESVIDCSKAGGHLAKRIVEAAERGEYTEAEAAGLVKLVTDRVESRCAEIRKQRGQRKAG
jgi:hypothetical protein